MKKPFTIALSLIMMMTLGTSTFAKSAPSLPSGTVRFEAEAAQLAGSAQVEDNETASNGKFVSYIDETGSSVTIKNTPVARMLTVGYSRGNDDSGKMSLYLNDAHVQDVTFPNTGDWYGIKTQSVTLAIPAGANVKLQFDEDDQPINIDYIDFDTNSTGAVTTPAPVTTPEVKPVTTVKPVVKPAVKPAATKKPVVKPAVKPAKIVPVTAKTKAAGKALAAQVKKLAEAKGKGLSAIISKNGLILGLGYRGDGLSYEEQALKANMIQKDAKGLPFVKLGQGNIKLGDEMSLLKAIKTSPKVQELTLKANLSVESYQSQTVPETFHGVIYQPNGNIIVAAMGEYGASVWMYFKSEGSSYKLYKMDIIYGV